MAGWFILLSAKQRMLFAVLVGAISALAMPPFDLVFVLFFTFPILVWLIDGAVSEPSTRLISRLWDGFKPGFFFGFGYFLAGLWWIGNAFFVEATEFIWVLPLALIIIPTVLALFWGVGTALASLFWKSDFRKLFMLAACFALVEYLRSFVATGLPWNPIASAAYFTTPLMQSASVIGVYGMTAFAVFTFASVGIIGPGIEHQKKGCIFVLICAVGFTVSHIGYGIWRLPSQPMPLVEGVSLRLMQPNIQQADKFNPEKEAEIIKTYLDLSTQAGEGEKKGLAGTTHLIWPESSFPFFLTERRDMLSSIAAMLPQETSLITGAVRLEAATANGKDFVFNSVYIVDHKGEIVSASDKMHLVPFGEYLPFQEFVESLGIRQLTKLEGGFSSGSSRKLLSTGKGPQFLPLICYEIIFSGELWKYGKQADERPGWIVNVTNDGWYGNTPGPYQHERQAILRAVEEGLPVIRVSNTGISGVYDPYGKVIHRLELSTAGVIDAGLPKALQTTYFVRYGQSIYLFIFIAFLMCGLFPLRKS